MIGTNGKVPIKLENGNYMIHTFVRKDGKKPRNPLSSGQFAELIREVDDEHDGEELECGICEDAEGWPIAGLGCNGQCNIAGCEGDFHGLV